MIYKQGLHFQSVYKVLLALLNPFFAEYKWWLGYPCHGVQAGMVINKDRLGSSWVCSSQKGRSDCSGFLLYSVLADKTLKAIALAKSPLTNF